MNIGIDLGGSHVAVGMVDNEYNIIDKKEHIWTKEEKADFFLTVERYCKKLIKEIINENKHVQIDKIGIGYPSAYISNGIVNKGEEKLDLPKILFKEFNIPVYLKNDVKCSAFCEKSIGNLKKYDNCVFMTLGTGIGGAYFYKNELVIPNSYAGLEIGHMIIQTDGKKCKCGQMGCFEEYASMRIFRQQIKELFKLEKLTSIEMKKIIRSREKELEVNKIIDNYLKYLSTGIINIINIFEPDAICIGGSFTYYKEIFMDKLIKIIGENFKNRNIPDIITAKYENDAGIIGSSMLESS